MASSRYVIGPFLAYRINLSGSDFVAEIPSPGAALGFAGALARKLGETGWDHKATLIIHKLDVSHGRPRGEQIVKSKRLVPLEIPESITGHGLFTLLVEIPGVHGLFEIKDAIETMRFAGGAIFPQHGKSFGDICRKLNTETYSEVIRSLPRGMALCPPCDRADTQTVSFGDILSLEAIANRAYRPSEKQKGGYVVPVPVGYRVLPETYQDTAPAGCRDRTLPFAMVDSAVGLGEFISIRNKDAFGTIEKAFGPRSWHWSCDTTGHLKMFSAYHLQNQILETQ